MNEAICLRLGSDNVRVRARERGKRRLSFSEIGASGSAVPHFYVGAPSGKRRRHESGFPPDAKFLIALPKVASMQRPSFRLLLGFALPVLATSAAGQAFSPPLSLAVDDPFPAIGSPVQLALTGPSGAFFFVHGSATPVELPLGSLGILVIDTSTDILLASGVLDGSGGGSGTVPVPPSPALDGLLFHLQGIGVSGADLGLSNGVPIRIGLAPKSGPRNPESIAVTPDGAKAYVAHRADGSVSVIDVASETLLYDRPVGPVPAGEGFPARVRIDPEGRHAFVLSPHARKLGVLHVASDSVVAQLDVPLGCRDVAFDFAGPVKTVYVTSERDDAILRFSEPSPGFFAPLAPIPLEGRDPGALAVRANGELVVGSRTSHDVEIVDPSRPAGSTTVACLPLGKLPYDVAVSGNTALVATFDTSAPGDGENQMVAIDLNTVTAVGSHLNDRGTDYRDVALAGSRLALTGAGSGSVVIADAATFAFQGISDLAPFQVLATPQESAFVVDGGGEPKTLLVANFFRESVAVVDVTAVAPFLVTAEIPLAYDGAIKLPLSGDLTRADDGKWWFRTVQFLNGTPQTPNPVTCATCHPFGAGSDGLLHGGLQAIPTFNAGGTGPWGSKGATGSLLFNIQLAFQAHKLTGSVPLQADEDVFEYLTNGVSPPPSPFRNTDGSLTAAAQAGKVVFETKAGCSTCHAAPLFIPKSPNPLTIQAGVGTGLVPANVPSLRAAWATAPYLHDHSAQTLMDVLLQNPGDQHGTTSSLTQQELDELVEYVKSL